jgi:hypothetical protein
VYVGVYVAVALIAGSPAASKPGESVPLQPGRTTSVVVTIDVGAPLERAVPGRAYAQAVTADGEQRWADAAALYREATTEWNAAARLNPSRALELAAAKAERERQRSQLLAARVRGTTSRAGRDPTVRRADALEEARLLRSKLFATRAGLGRVPPALFAKTRDRLQEALHAGDAPDGGEPPSITASNAEIHLALCSTYAAVGDVEAARLARAHVTAAERSDPGNRLALAVCAAALGETRTALAELEVMVLHPSPSRADRYQLRELYLANDWDRLRGDPRFESLFPR